MADEVDQAARQGSLQPLAGSSVTCLADEEAQRADEAAQRARLFGTVHKADEVIQCVVPESKGEQRTGTEHKHSRMVEQNGGHGLSRRVEESEQGRYQQAAALSMAWLADEAAHRARCLIDKQLATADDERAAGSAVLLKAMKQHPEDEPRHSMADGDNLRGRDDPEITLANGDSGRNPFREYQKRVRELKVTTAASSQKDER